MKKYKICIILLIIMILLSISKITKAQNVEFTNPTVNPYMSSQANEGGGGR